MSLLATILFCRRKRIDDIPVSPVNHPSQKGDINTFRYSAGNNIPVPAKLNFLTGRCVWLTMRPYFISLLYGT